MPILLLIIGGDTETSCYISIIDMVTNSDIAHNAVIESMILILSLILMNHAVDDAVDDTGCSFVGMKQH